MKKVRTRKLLAMLITLTLAFTMVLPMNFTASAATEVIYAEDFNNFVPPAWNTDGVYMWPDNGKVENGVYKKIGESNASSLRFAMPSNKINTCKKIEYSFDLYIDKKNTTPEYGYMVTTYANNSTNSIVFGTRGKKFFVGPNYFNTNNLYSGEIAVDDAKLNICITIDFANKNASMRYKEIGASNYTSVDGSYAIDFDTTDVNSIVFFNSSTGDYTIDNVTIKDLTATKIASVSQTDCRAANDANAVGLNDSFTVTFDNAGLDLADLQSSVKLLDANNIEVATTKAWNNTTKTYTLTPVSPLGGQSKYTLTTAGLEDNDGNDVLDTGSVVFFTIAEPRVLKNQLTDWKLGEGFTLESNKISVAEKGASAAYSSLMFNSEKNGIFEIEVEMTSTDWNSYGTATLLSMVDDDGAEMPLLVKNTLYTYGGHHTGEAGSFKDNDTGFVCKTCGKTFTYINIGNTAASDVLKIRYEINTLTDTMKIYKSLNNAEFAATTHNNAGECTGEGAYSFKVAMKELRLYTQQEMPYTLSSFSVTDYTPLVGMDVDITVDGDAYTDGTPLTAGEKAVAAVFKNVNEADLATASVILAMYGADKSLKEVAAVSIPDGLGYAETKTIADLNWTAAEGDFIRAFHWNSFTKLTPLSRAE